MTAHQLRPRVRLDGTSASSLFRSFRLPGSRSRSARQSQPAEDEDLISNKLKDVIVRTFYLGFTSFGGPPAHFQIFHKSFVEGQGRRPWIDEQTYQELFAICQATPGPGSTKMLFCITLLRAGFLPALMVFLFWSLPVALGMYGLALGVRRIEQVLPSPVYALLSGLNASTVGIIALSAVQLARKAITDPLTRLLVLIAACAGLCYNALWYFPLIMVIGGIATLIWDCWLRGIIGRWKAKRENARRASNPDQGIEANELEEIRKRNAPSPASPPSLHSQNDEVLAESAASAQTTQAPKTSIRIGIALVIAFFCSFALFMVIRGTVTAPLAYQLFANMYLAGTIIFGGGPVVIPLLREYVVEPGWVQPRDFLIGLAIIQALPGPNFNFAVYLGALALSGSPQRMFLGSCLGFLGIFAPGIILSVGFQNIWKAVRSNRFVVSVLRGVNAAAVGLVFTAVYRLWEIGYLTVDESRGRSLGANPWWVVVTASTYVLVESFDVPAAVAIVSGGVLGLAWWGAVGR
ncbi:hypothetical protein AX16_005971 [Volvariella volvacea WC 439]|nr:hypothetical protein AX16_005971 [Volvariella volvacea WC 439]